MHIYIHLWWGYPERDRGEEEEEEEGLLQQFYEVRIDNDNDGENDIKNPNNERVAVNQTETEPQKIACANACESSTK